MRFLDRADAGRRLAAALHIAAHERPVVLALPRGGVPVATEVAAALGAPLDVLVVRKLGVPFQPELGMGAVGEDGVRVLNPDLIRRARVSEHDLDDVTRREQAELDRRVRAFRGDRPRLDLHGRTAIVVDDGLATGFTARAAIEVVRHLGAARVVLAVPVAPADTAASLREVADEVVCLHTPTNFWAIGEWYDDFHQLTDGEVAAQLAEAHRPEPAEDPGDEPRLVTVRAAAVVLPGRLHLPAGAPGVVVFAHGSGSGWRSPRNEQVAEALGARGIGTLLFDLLTPDEGASRANVFDIPLLAARVLDAVAWVRAELAPADVRIGLFGASTGAAAALDAAARLGDQASAVVSRGGRPDLATRLADVRAPTLLVVGGRDDVVIDLNRQAAALLRCPHELVVVPGATHLFEEPGTLEQVVDLAGEWFARWMAGSPPDREGDDG